MSKLNLKSGLRFVATTKIAVGIVVISILGLTALQFQYLATAASIEKALAVEPQSINFGFVLPATSQERQVAVSLSESWLESGRTETVGYFVSKNPKCSSWNENGTCAEYFLDLCSFLSLNPEQGALTQANPTGNVSVVLNYPTQPEPGEPQLESGEPLAPDLLGRRFWCELRVGVVEISPENPDTGPGDSNEVSPEDPNAGGPGDSSSTSTAESLLPFLSPLAKLFESFPTKTAHAFEAHIVDVSAVFLAGSPAQVALTPEISWFEKHMKEVAIEVSFSRHDPLTDAALSTLTMATAISCLAPEPLATKVFCVGSLLTMWGAKEFMWASYDLLALDPPREDFDVSERIKPAKPVKPFGNSAFAEATARYTTSLLRHGQLVDAVRITNERLQGAIIADSGEHMLLQSRLSLEFLERLGESNAHHQEVIKQILHRLPKAWNEDMNQVIGNWASEGLSDEEKQTLLAGGLSEEDIAKIEEIFSNASVVEGDYFGALQSGLQNEVELMQNALPTIEEGVSVFELTIGALEGIVCSGQSQPDICL